MRTTSPSTATADVQLIATDLSELERILVDSGGFGRERLEREVAKADGSLCVFARSLVGLDRAAAKDALSGFVHGSTFTAAQIKFVELIVEYLTPARCRAAAAALRVPVHRDRATGTGGVLRRALRRPGSALHHIHQRALAS